MNEVLKGINDLINEKMKKAASDKVETEAEIMKCDREITEAQGKAAKCTAANDIDGWKEARKDEEYQKERKTYLLSRLQSIEVEKALPLAEYNAVVQQICTVAAEATVNELEGMKESLYALAKAYNEAEQTYEEAKNVAFALYRNCTIKGNKEYKPVSDRLQHWGFIGALSNVRSHFSNPESVYEELKELTQYKRAIGILEDNRK